MRRKIERKFKRSSVLAQPKTKTTRDKRRSGDEGDDDKSEDNVRLNSNDEGRE
jgi:hypothetical protein